MNQIAILSGSTYQLLEIIPGLDDASYVLCESENGGLFLRYQIDPESRAVTGDIGNLAKIQLFYVGFGQKDGAGIVHIDGKRLIYHAHPRGVKRKNRQDLSENVIIHGSTRYDLVKPQRKVAQIS